MVARPWRFYRHTRAELQSTTGLTPSFVRKRPELAATLLLGLTGVAQTNAAAPVFTQLLVRPAEQPDGRSTDYELYFLKRKGGASLEVALDGKVVASTSANAEATSPGYLAFQVGDDAQHQLAVSSQGDGPVTLFGLTSERQGAGVVLDTLGIPGARARSQLYWDHALLQEHVQRRHPDLVVLAYGTNESTDVEQPIEDYAASLRKVVEQLRALAPEASCLLVGPTDFPEKISRRSYQPRERTAQIIRVQRAAASEHGCAFFDTVAATGGPLSMLRWARMTPPLGGRDLIHFTRPGYEAIADKLTDLLLDGVDTAQSDDKKLRAVRSKGE
jgi:lysophospholipase L1-like esterase